MFVSNTGGSDIPYGWSVEMYNPLYTGGSGAWNMQVDSGNKDWCMHVKSAVPIRTSGTAMRGARVESDV